MSEENQGAADKQPDQQEAPLTKAQRRAARRAAEAASNAGKNNDFGGNVDKDGKETQPAKDPSPNNEEREFLDYVRGELSEIAQNLGYVVRVERAEKQNSELQGPTAFFNRRTREMRVFNSLSEVPADFVRRDELDAE